MKIEIKKNNKWCNFFGHKWEVAFIKGKYKNIEIKFIGAYCKRCKMGYNELMETVKKQTSFSYNTYSEKYFLEEK